jgi:hypothetical protein
MKRLLILVLGTGLLALLSCEAELAVPTACKATAAGDTIVLTLNQPKPVFADCDTALTATVGSISDSRCPLNAICAWAGTVFATISLGDHFSTTLQIGHQKDTSFQNRNYSLLLVNVTPYPDLNQANPPVQQAFIRITRK